MPLTLVATIMILSSSSLPVAVTPISARVTGRPTSVQKSRTSSISSISRFSSTSWVRVPNATFSPWYR